MTPINDKAHDVVDKACENLTKWPRDFIGQEDLVMLIHEAITAAVEDARREWARMFTDGSECQAAVEEEREACAQVAQDHVPGLLEYEDGAARYIAESIRDKIRARCTSPVRAWRERASACNKPDGGTK